MKQPWDDPDAPPKSDAGRLREILRYMNVPQQRVQPLDLTWLAQHLDQWASNAHYPEARSLCVSLLDPDRSGRSRRL